MPTPTEIGLITGISSSIDSDFPSEKAKEEEEGEIFSIDANNFTSHIRLLKNKENTGG